MGRTHGRKSPHIFTLRGHVNPAPLMLIVRRQRLKPEILERVVNALSAFALDQYTTRVNLNGVGMALLARGSREELARIGRVLDEHGLSWAITPPVSRTASPLAVRRLSVDDGALRLEDRNGRGIHISKKSRVLAVLGGMDGKQVGRIVNARQWSSQSDKPFTRAQQYRSLIQGEPVLDLLVLDSGTNPDTVSLPDSHLRVIPGRFDPSGLGDAASASSRMNLDRLLTLLKERAGSFDLDMDFGIGGLPGCMPDFSQRSAEEHNLRALSNYALYAFRVRRGLSGDTQAAARPVDSPQSPLHALAPALATALDGLSQPVTAGPGPVDLPELSYSGADEAIAEPGDLPATTLPPPPPAENVNTRNVLKHVRLNPIIAIAAAFAPPLLALLASMESLAGAREWLAYVFIGRGGLAAVVSVFALWLCTRYFRLKRWIDNLPTSRVRSLAMGMVELTGVAERAYNLVSPVSGITCVWFRVNYFVRAGLGQAGKHDKWKWVGTRHSGKAPFYLRDDTGRVLVNPEGAQLTGVHRSVYSGEFSGMLSGGMRIGADERIIEEVIPELQPLYVLGFAAPLDKPDSCLKQRTIERLRELKADRDALMRYDRDGNGVIDPDEWREAVADARRQAIAQTHTRQQPNAAGAPETVVMAPEEGRLPFIISMGGEREITRRYALLSIGCFVIALASLVVAVLQIAFGSVLQ